MTSQLSKKFKFLARRYWQHSMLVLLALLVLLQVISWAETWLELRTIDRLIAAAEEPVVAPDEQKPGSNPKPGNSLPVPPDRSASREQKEEERKPKKDIFRRERIPYNLSGIFMDTAVIDNKYVKVGDQIGKAVVKEIHPTSVIIQEEGKTDTRTLQLFQGSDSGPVVQNSETRSSGPPSGGRASRTNRPGRGSRSMNRQTASTGNISLNFETVMSMSREEIMRRRNSVSEEDQQRFWNGLSPDQRQRIQAKFGQN
ncbi:MAG: hypothetical protein ACOX5R_11570 [bacterium]|jgi:type II secretory pathway component PulC